MKSLIAFAVLLAANQLSAASTGVTLTQAEPTKPSAEKSPPTAEKPAAKKEEKTKPAPAPAPAPEPVIPGTAFVRPNGNFIGFEVVANQIKVSFYDKKKKSMAVDVPRGLARWPDPRGGGQVRTPLNVSGTALVGAKPALPPFNYTITIQLLAGEGEDADVVESYSVPFRG